MHLDEPLPENCPPRILHLVHGLNFGGIETWLLAVLQNMPPQKFAMDIAYKGPSEGSLAPVARAAGVQLLHCPLGPTVFPFIQRLKVILRQEKYSLLHVHTHAHSGPAVYAANAIGVPVVTTFHNTQHPPETRFTSLPIVRQARSVYARQSMRYALKYSSVCTGSSNAVANAAIESTKCVQGKCQVLHTGCLRPQSLSSHQLVQYRREFNLTEGAPVVIHVGSFHGRKNHLALLQVFCNVIQSSPCATLFMVGDGPLRPIVQQKAVALGLNGHVRFLGIRRDATALMQVAHVLLFPSLHEGLPQTLMEASAIGLPIVASDIPPNREVSGNGTSARLHEVSDIGGMAASVLELINDPGEAQRLASMGRETYERSFSIDHSVQRLITLYEEVLQSQRLRRSAA